MEIARETQGISETRLERERIRNQLGGASSTDFLNAQVSFNNDQSDLLDRELRMSIAREELNVLLGQDPATIFTVSQEIAIPELSVDFEQVRDLAIERNSSLRSAQLAKKVADRNVQTAYSPFMPKLSLQANYGYSDQTNNSKAGQYPGHNIGTKTTTGTVGLSLSHLTCSMVAATRSTCKTQESRQQTRLWHWPMRKTG
ncbi:MAG: TolC family protein [candidate division Zixibacteria bacterium]|nr:TolC family protein [candidate division Zixibacteria bacterium]MBU1470222.1 TolC family protein [candidate division Zixibacteria bacterium]